MMCYVCFIYKVTLNKYYLLAKINALFLTHRYFHLDIGMIFVKLGLTVNMRLQNPLLTDIQRLEQSNFAKLIEDVGYNRMGGMFLFYVCLTLIYKIFVF